jgi:hypothetical protein
LTASPLEPKSHRYPSYIYAKARKGQDTTKADSSLAARAAERRRASASAASDSGLWYSLGSPRGEQGSWRGKPQGPPFRILGEDPGSPGFGRKTAARTPTGLSRPITGSGPPGRKAHAVSVRVGVDLRESSNSRVADKLNRR